MTLPIAEANRQLQIALEHRRGVREALADLHSFDDELEQCDYGVKLAEDEAERAWLRQVCR